MRAKWRKKRVRRLKRKRRKTRARRYVLDAIALPFSMELSSIIHAVEGVLKILLFTASKRLATSRSPLPNPYHHALHHHAAHYKAARTDDCTQVRDRYEKGLQQTITLGCWWREAGVGQFDIECLTRVLAYLTGDLKANVWLACTSSLAVEALLRIASMKCPLLQTLPRPGT